MEDIKLIFAKNITELRSANGWTQAELAEKLHYSDKAVSKWERGESVPEIGTLLSIADLFGISLDYLIRGKEADLPEAPTLPHKVRNHRLITGLSVLLVWFIALLAFVSVDVMPMHLTIHWLSFVYAVPVSMIVWLVFNSIWFNPRWNFLIISILMWSILLSIHLTLLPFGIHFWQLYFLGIPGQIAIILWSNIRSGKRK